jgi:hypothetical protein
MGLTQEDVSTVVKFLNSENQRGVFVLDEFTVVGAFWERIKKAIKDENYDLDAETLDLLSRVLNTCLTRKGNEPDVLRVILSLIDKVQAVQDTLKDSSTPSTIEEVSSN